MNAAEASYQAHTVIQQYREAVSPSDVHTMERLALVDKCIDVLAAAAGVNKEPVRPHRQATPTEIIKETSKTKIQPSMVNHKAPPRTPEVPATAAPRTPEAPPRTPLKKKGPTKVPLPKGLESGSQVIVLDDDGDPVAEGVLISEWVTNGTVSVELDGDEEENGIIDVELACVEPVEEDELEPAGMTSKAPPKSSTKSPPDGDKDDSVELSEIDRTTLRALWAASSVNSHEFGITSRIQNISESVKMASIVRLTDMGYIEVADEVAPGVVQFVFTDEGRSLFRDFKKSPNLGETVMPKKSTAAVEVAEAPKRSKTRGAKPAKPAVEEPLEDIEEEAVEEEAVEEETAAPKRGAKARATAPAEKASEGDNPNSGINREKDVPWSDKKVQVFQGLKALKATTPQNAATANAVSEHTGLSNRDVRHYCYHARAAGLIEVAKPSEGKGYTFYLTATGRALDPVKELKKQKSEK